MAVIRTGTQIFSGCHLYDHFTQTTQLESTQHGKSVSFFDVFYRIEGLKSGMHHPDGMLWIRTPNRAHSQHAAKVPLAAVAPTLLDLMNIPKPSTMAEESVLSSAPIRQPALTGV